MIWDDNEHSRFDGRERGRKKAALWQLSGMEKGRPVGRPSF
jgi:hypothetical protein